MYMAGYRPGHRAAGACQLEKARALEGGKDGEKAQDWSMDGGGRYEDAIGEDTDCTYNME